MNVNPDAGLSSPTVFRPDALYEFKVDSDGDAIENLGFRLRFGELATDGSQLFELFHTRYAVGQIAEEQLLASGRADEVIQISHGGRLWAGLAGDPFREEFGYKQKSQCWCLASSTKKPRIDFLN